MEMVNKQRFDRLGTASGINQPARNASCNFYELVEPQFLNASFALRYEVYCKERRFLTPDNYPQKHETDRYDSYSIHVGGTNSKGEMVGTVRLVSHSTIGFPLFEHCKLFPQYEHLASPQSQITTAEISRLAFTKNYKEPLSTRTGQREHAHDDADECGGAAPAARAPLSNLEKAGITLGIYKTIYQISKRRGITHWYAAMEKSLLRLMRRFHIAFTPIGPELDYYGPVTPYVLALSEMEKALHQHCPATFADFIDGLEPEFRPTFA